MGVAHFVLLGDKLKVQSARLSLTNQLPGYLVGMRNGVKIPPGVGLKSCVTTANREQPFKSKTDPSDLLIIAF